MQRASSPGVTVPPATPDEIRAHLARILASPAFRASKRCHRFLEFIVSQFLAGNSASIKERTLAIEVFDRSTSWDSGGDDTIVRVGAREVRKRLAQFYSSSEGMREKIRIELPLGSYVPEIVRVEYALPANPVVIPAPPVPVSIDIIAPATAPPVGRRLWPFVVLVVVVGMAASVYSMAKKPTPFDEFWGPFLHAPDPLLIGVASPVVYTPSARAYALNDSKRHEPPSPVVKPLALPPSELNGSDFIPVEDQFLAFGDAVASTSMQLLLAKHSREAHVRFASRVEFAEFRDGPVLLIGAFTNRWTMELSQHFRFHFGFNSHWAPAILDSSKSDDGWTIHQRQENGTSPDDYFLICRLRTSPSGTPIIIAAGVEQFGTEAAGRFLADRGQMNAVLKGLGKDWASKNLELVMHDKVIDNSPAAPELVASYMW